MLFVAFVLTVFLFDCIYEVSLRLDDLRILSAQVVLMLIAALRHFLEVIEEVSVLNFGFVT